MTQNLPTFRAPPRSPINTNHGDRDEAAAVAVTVPSLGMFINEKVETMHSNLPLLTTIGLTISMGLLLGLCFVLVAVPLLYIAGDYGRRVYAAIMVPLLTVLGTIMGYYATQYPQRTLNSALMRTVREMERHTSYLTVALKNVEEEFAARRIRLGYTPGGSSRVPSGSTALTPEEAGLPSLKTFGGSGPFRSPSVSVTGGGVDLLLGIEELGEDAEDMVIAKVHIGKEWRWLKSLLGKLNMRSLTGLSNPMTRHQCTTIHALASSVARVEKLILSLYFSSIVLQRANEIAAVSPWGLSGSGGGGGMAHCDHTFGHPTGQHKGVIATYATSLQQKIERPIGAPSSLGPNSSSPPSLGMCKSRTNSIFNNPKVTPFDTDDVEETSPTPLGKLGVTDDTAEEDGASDLSSPNGRNFVFGKQVRLPVFSPLISGGGRKAQGEGKKVQHRASPAAPQGPEKPPGKAPGSANGATTSREAGPPVHPGTPSDRKQRTFAVPGDDANPKGHKGKPMPSAVACNSQHQAAPPPLPLDCGESNSNRSRSDTAAPALLSPGNVWSALPSTSSFANNSDANAGRMLAVPRTVSDTRISAAERGRNASSAVSSTSTRRPFGSLVRPSRPEAADERLPSLTLYRGARFPGDTDDVFLTILLHVEKSDAVLYSRLYIAQAKVKRIDSEKGTHVFATNEDALVGPTTYAHGKGTPFTVFYVTDRDGLREGLTILEQKLLHLAYCQLEETVACDEEGRPCATDFSSLAVKRGPSCDRGDAAGATTAASLGNATVDATHGSGTTSSEVPPAVSSSAHPAHWTESFIIAWGLLADRPMRLTFLPAVIQALPDREEGQVAVQGPSAAAVMLAPPQGPAARSTSSPSALDVRERDRDPPTIGIRGAPELLGSVLPHRPQSSRGADTQITEEEAGGEERKGKGATTNRGCASAERGDGATFPKMVPVLECVVDDVLCVLTSIEVTVDPYFERPSKLLLVGVSLEDISAQVSDRVDEELGDEVSSLESDAVSKSLDISGVQRLADPCRTPPKPTNGPSTPHSTRRGGNTRVGASAPRGVAAGTALSSVNLSTGPRLTLGREYREVINLN